MTTTSEPRHVVMQLPKITCRRCWVGMFTPTNNHNSWYVVVWYRKPSKVRDKGDWEHGSYIACEYEDGVSGSLRLDRFKTWFNWAPTIPKLLDGQAPCRVWYVEEVYLWAMFDRDKQLIGLNVQEG